MKKNIKILLLVAMCCLFYCSLAQVPAIHWKKSFGSTGGDGVNAMLELPQGYIFVGRNGASNGNVAINYGDDDLWIIRTDTLGTIQWQKSLGGTSGESAEVIEKTADGGYILAGFTYSSDGHISRPCQGHSDYWIVKTDSLWNIQWEKSYGGSAFDFAHGIQPTSDGGYIVVGEASSSNGDVIGNHGSTDCWVLKLSSTGIIQWQKSFGGSDWDKAMEVKQTIDGGYIIAGGGNSADGDRSVGSKGATDYWVIKTDSLGNIQWQKSYGGTGNDYLYSLLVKSDGYILGGYSESNNGDITNAKGISDVWILKINNSGNIQWQKSYGGSGYDEGTYMSETNDGGYILAAYSSSNDGDVTATQWYNGNWDYWVIKTDSLANIEWQKSYGGSNADQATVAKQTTDGSYIVAGISQSNNGDVSGNHGGWDFWILKLKGPVITAIDDEFSEKLSIYPNPAKAGDRVILPFSTTKIEICDLMGKVVYRGYGDSFEIQDSWNSGLYLILISDEKNFFRAKLKIE